MSLESNLTPQGRGITHPTHQMKRTSLDAYDLFVASGRSRTIKQKILGFLEAFSDQRFTSKRLESILGIQRCSLTKPIYDLREGKSIDVEIAFCPIARLNVEHYSHKKRKESTPTLFD